MRVFLNDKAHQIAAGATVADLLSELKLPSRQVAIELNGELLPRERYPQQTLAEGDRLEVVTLVGGG